MNGKHRVTHLRLSRIGTGHEEQEDVIMVGISEVSDRKVTQLNSQLFKASGNLDMHRHGPA